MKLVSVTAALAAIVAAPALAADVVKPAPKVVIAPPVYDWSGHYLGIHGGYFKGDAKVHEDNVAVAITGGDVSGFVGGVLGGFNVLHNGHILGIEGDFGWTNASGTGGAIPVDEYHYDLHWTAHLRGRFGVPHNNTLWFVAGGAAFAGFDVYEDVLPSGGTYTGWTLGAGVDHAFSPSLVGRAEFLYDDFGGKSYDDFSASLTGWTGRVALIWRFGQH